MRGGQRSGRSDREQPALPQRASRVLRLHRQLRHFVLAEIGRVPCTPKEIEPKLLADRIVDHVAVAATEARCAHPHRAQDVLINRQRRRRLCRCAWGRRGCARSTRSRARRGVTRAKAVRQAIAETAERERRRAGLAAKAQAASLAHDPAYIAEAREVAALMDRLRDAR